MVSCTRISFSGLFLCLIVSLLFSPNPVAASDGFCPVPTIPAQVTYQVSWFLGWADGSPPQQIQRNMGVEIGVVGVFPPFDWQVSGHGATIQPIVEDGSIAEIFVDCAATDPITVTVTDNYGHELAADILVVDEAFEWDFASTGTDPIAANGQKSVHVLGGSPVFTWVVSEPGFWFDPAHTIQEITTDAESVILYADETACGAATITVIDGCGDTVSGYVKSTNGTWSAWTIVAEVSDSEMGCPGGGATYADHVSVCEGVSPIYQYQATRFINGQTLICKRPYCRDGAECTGSGTACHFEISDGTCTYIWDLANRCGASLVQLRRSDWTCP